MKVNFDFRISPATNFFAYLGLLCLGALGMSSCGTDLGRGSVTSDEFVPDSKIDLETLPVWEKIQEFVQKMPECHKSPDSWQCKIITVESSAEDLDWDVHPLQKIMIIDDQLDASVTTRYANRIINRFEPIIEGGFKEAHHPMLVQASHYHIYRDLLAGNRSFVSAESIEESSLFTQIFDAVERKLGPTDWPPIRLGHGDQVFYILAEMNPEAAFVLVESFSSVLSQRPDYQAAFCNRNFAELRRIMRPYEEGLVNIAKRYGISAVNLSMGSDMAGIYAAWSSLCGGIDSLHDDSARLLLNINTSYARNLSNIDGLVLFQASGDSAVATNLLSPEDCASHQVYPNRIRVRGLQSRDISNHAAGEIWKDYQEKYHNSNSQGECVDVLISHRFPEKNSLVSADLLFLSEGLPPYFNVDGEGTNSMWLARMTVASASYLTPLALSHYLFLFSDAEEKNQSSTKENISTYTMNHSVPIYSPYHHQLTSSNRSRTKISNWKAKLN